MARGRVNKKASQAKTRTAPTAGAKPAAKPSLPDEALWQHVAETVKPLKTRRPSPPKPPALPPSSASEDAPSQPRLGTAPPVKRAPKPPLPELKIDTAAGVDKRTSQRLSRGQLSIEGRLDLHGLTQDEAHSRLSGFIRRAVGAGKRNVLVITGKGFKAGGEIGVLRQAVPRWLNEPALRRHIVTLRHAQPKDGGEGALYVLLRRERTASADQDHNPAKRLSCRGRGS